MRPLKLLVGHLEDSMAATRDVALANRQDAFMRLMRLGPLPQRSRLFEAYERDGWPGVHDEIVRMLV